MTNRRILMTCAVVTLCTACSFGSTGDTQTTDGDQAGAGESATGVPAGEGTLTAKVATHTDSGSMQAALVGRLVVVDGCLYVQTEEPRSPVLPVFPAGAEVKDGGLHLPGKDQPVPLGQDVTIGGGFVPEAPKEGVPTECTAFTKVFVSGGSVTVGADTTPTP